MRNNIATLGAQWGDEGKGKITDLLAADAHAIFRFNGGAKAGHTLWGNGQKYVTHLLPSGVLYKDVNLALGQGMVIDPIELVSEIKTFENLGCPFSGRLFIDPAAHVVLPRHKIEDGAKEDAAGASKLGTTKRGIGPCYGDKHRYIGLRLIDIARMPVVPDDLTEVRKAVEFLAPYFHDVSYLADKMIDRGQRVVFEGAQAALLDVDHGQYPFVSSSSAIAGGICTGIGLSPHSIGQLIGVVKAYATKVGAGPMPTEITGDLGEHIRKVGSEFGATTGRPRRIGWVDLPLLAYAQRINGFTSLALTKIDCLRGINPLRVCYAYKNKVTEQKMLIGVPPADTTDYSQLEPLYHDFPGFNEDISGMRKFEELPKTLQDFINFVQVVGVAIDMIGVGPDRDQIIVRKNLWE